MKKDMIIHEAPKAPVSEAIRTLRTSLMYKANKINGKIFLVTSSTTEEGKSWVTSNLAISFSQSKQRVLVIDCDLRRGRQHRIFEIDNKYGLSKGLDSKEINRENPHLQFEINKLIKSTEIENVSLIPSGPVPHNPSELFENDQFNILLDTVRDQYDIILLDAPPVSIVTDSMILCTKTDGIVLVCAINRSKREALLESKKKIVNMGGNILGVVVNKMPCDRMKEYNKDYSKYSDNQIIRYGGDSFRAS